MRLGIGWILALGACSANDDVPAPMLSGVTPDRAAAGTSVMISGSYFCGQPSTDSEDVDPLACALTGFVRFGSSDGTLLQYTDTAITAEVPASSPGPTRLVVNVGGRISNAIVFVVD